ncbi:bifunctional enoyl-CoA hydratase/phosphate acetyltransferase [Isachenkonia alkalipeptolytica]|uniref:Bifunctional enoyl-CoA hydratase/phosphate acetyltransferase n=1 Tax=Isachenkonia alkalipeptolytica TaxID=2565777 RepID=A0AA43XNZ8_9CLOT|nr:bifunctional enoyl-CoA hydratase/phosphate acetyltransferase [Isachenkonia alkalipeptolytica]NBG89649.1 bifunctional enoyl-CoA hydratase/phosphate acetyltransferase [Isachenkonia alkalipeptolytica]
MIKSLKDLKVQAKNQEKMTLVVAAAEDKDVLSAVMEAKTSNIINAVLVGEKKSIEEIAREIGFDLQDVKVIEASGLEKSAETSVRLISEGKADFLMKGKIDTSILLKAVLDKDYGLRTERLLSHVMVYEVPSYHKLLLMSDGGMNIAPTFDQKEDILRNALLVSQAMGNHKTFVSCLAAKEKTSEKMPATMDGQRLKERALDKAYGEDVYVEGPIAFDLAVSKDAARIKGYESPVVGETDILLVPTIEVGNGIGKTMTYMAGGESAGVIMGAKAPIVLVSRADSAETKFYSIALGSVISAATK